MSIESVFNIVTGLGLFLYGMNLLSSSLSKFAGSEVKNILKKVTDRPINGVLLGAVVTAVIQSSTAATLMSMGLVSSGNMTVFSAVPIIMGANIGSTVTAQILSLSEISGSNLFFSMLKPSSFAPFFILIGAVQQIFLKKPYTKQSADVFIGLGILFTGIEITEAGLLPLSELSEFKRLFITFKNPVAAVLLGTLATAVIQSSSVCVGILQTLSTTGVITFSTAVPIILGMNIGKCLPEFIASISTDKCARRTILADLIINILGSAGFFIVVYSLQSIFDLPFWENAVTKNTIALFHTFFNIMTTLILLPFYKKVILLTEKIIK